MNKLTFSLIFLQFALLQTLSAQGDNPDFMRSTGKIYVVVAVIIAMFIGILLFLIFIERKLTKLENQITNDE